MYIFSHFTMRFAHLGLHILYRNRFFFFPSPLLHLFFFNSVSDMQTYFNTKQDRVTFGLQEL